LLLDQMGGGLVRDWIQGPFGASVYHVQGDFQGNFHGVGDEATSDGSGGHDISKARGRHSAIPSIIPFTIPSTIPSTILSTIPVHASDLEGSIRGRGRGSCRAVYGALDPYILHAIGMESTIHPSRNSSAAAADAAGGDVEWAATVGEVGGKLRLKMSLCRKPLMEYVLPLLHFDEIVPRTDTHTDTHGLAASLMHALSSLPHAAKAEGVHGRRGGDSMARFVETYASLAELKGFYVCPFLNDVEEKQKVGLCGLSREPGVRHLVAALPCLPTFTPRPATAQTVSDDYVGKVGHVTGRPALGRQDDRQEHRQDDRQKHRQDHRRDTPRVFNCTQEQTQDDRQDDRLDTPRVFILEFIPSCPARASRAAFAMRSCGVVGAGGSIGQAANANNSVNANVNANAYLLAPQVDGSQEYRFAGGGGHDQTQRGLRDATQGASRHAGSDVKEQGQQALERLRHQGTMLNQDQGAILLAENPLNFLAGGGGGGIASGGTVVGAGPPLSRLPPFTPSHGPALKSRASLMGVTMNATMSALLPTVATRRLSPRMSPRLSPRILSPRGRGHGLSAAGEGGAESRSADHSGSGRHGVPVTWRESPYNVRDSPCNPLPSQPPPTATITPHPPAAQSSGTRDTIAGKTSGKTSGVAGDERRVDQVGPEDGEGHQNSHQNSCCYINLFQVLGPSQPPECPPPPTHTFSHTK